MINRLRASDTRNTTKVFFESKQIPKNEFIIIFFNEVLCHQQTNETEWARQFTQWTTKYLYICKLKLPVFFSLENCVPVVWISFVFSSVLNSSAQCSTNKWIYSVCYFVRFHQSESLLHSVHFHYLRASWAEKIYKFPSIRVCLWLFTQHRKSMRSVKWSFFFSCNET